MSTTHPEPVDAWHAHSGEAPAQSVHGETHPVTIAMVGIIGFAVIIVSILVLAGYFNAILSQEKVVKKELWDVRGEVRSTQAQWTQELNSYGWADAQAGLVRMPISQAMHAVAQEYASTP